MKPFFSVVIPTLNEERFLKHILTDLSKQKETDFEVVIVDAHSLDGTKKIAMEFHRLLPLRVIESDKRNVSYQRNIGAAESIGEYVFFIDADSRITRTFLKETKKFILKQKGLFFIPAIKAEDKSPQALLAFQIANIIIGISQYSKKPMASGGAMIVDKNLFSKIKGFSEHVFMAEDHQLVQTARNWGVTARFMDKISVKFSFRRMKKEGQLKVLYKTLIATVHFILNGKIDKKIIEYEMGGQLYGRKVKKWGIDSLLNYSLKQINDFIRVIFN